MIFRAGKNVFLGAGGAPALCFSQLEMLFAEADSASGNQFSRASHPITGPCKLFSRGGLERDPPLEIPFPLNFVLFSCQIFKIVFSINPFRFNTQIVYAIKLYNQFLSQGYIHATVHPCHCSYNSVSSYINTLGLKFVHRSILNVVQVQIHKKG
jgi:hypothetical protein